MKKRIIARSLAALMIVGMAGAPAFAKQCAEKPVRANSNTINPVAVAVTSKTARSWARQAWDKRCSQLYSGVWCNPAMSTGKKYTCNQAPNGVGGYKHICELEATPCRN